MQTDVDWRAEFAERVPEVQTRAALSFQGVRCDDTRNNLVGEVLALSWNSWLVCVRKGKDPREFLPSLVAINCRHARSGRTLCGGKAAREALHQVAQGRGGYVVLRLDGQGELAFADGAAELVKGKGTNPAAAAGCHVDWEAWIGTLDDRAISFLADCLEGRTTAELAHHYQFSMSRASQLRREYARQWRAYGVDGE